MRLNRKGLAAILRAITLTVFVADIFLGGYLLSIRVIVSDCVDRFSYPSGYGHTATTINLNFTRETNDTEASPTRKTTASVTAAGL